MRKAIASLLAGATVLSMVSMASFAKEGKAATLSLDLGSMTVGSSASEDVFKLTISGGADASVSSNPAGGTVDTPTDTLALFDGQSIVIHDTTFTIKASGTKLTLTATEAGATKSMSGLTGTITKESGSATVGGTSSDTLSVDQEGVTETVESVSLKGAKPTPQKGQVTLTADVNVSDSSTAAPTVEANQQVKLELSGNTDPNTKLNKTEGKHGDEFILTIGENETIDTGKVTVKITSVAAPEKTASVTIDVTKKLAQTGDLLSLEIKGADSIRKGDTNTLTAMGSYASENEVARVASVERVATDVEWTLKGATGSTKFADTKANPATLWVDPAQDLSKLEISVKSLTTTGVSNTVGEGSVTEGAKDPAGTPAKALSVYRMENGMLTPAGTELQPNSTYYINLSNAYAGVGSDIVDKNMFKIDLKKSVGGKFIKSYEVGEYKVGGSRIPAVKFSTVELFDDSDNKVVLDLSITPKKDAVDKGGHKVTVGKKHEFPSIRFYLSNKTQDADQEYQTGVGGVIIKPVANEENEIIWGNDDRDVARLTFEGDSSIKNFYPKLSTKWDSKYNGMIGDADAFLFDFVGRPEISSTSRATLEIYNPFVNRDGDYTVNVKDLRIYQINDDAVLGANTEEAQKALADGRVVEITDTAKLGTNENGDQVITLRTRSLGKYIVTDGTALLDQAADEEIVEEEVSTEKPTTGKPNPGTGF